jgi:hypothetical protein
MSVSQKSIGEMGTKETGSSTHENAHQLFTHLTLRINPDGVLKKDITVAWPGIASEFTTHFE